MAPPPPENVPEPITKEPPKTLPTEPTPTRQSSRINKGVNRQFDIEWETNRPTRKQNKNVVTSYVAIKNNPHGAFAVLAQRVNIKQALRDKDRRASILKALHGEIDNFEAPGVIKSTRLKDIPVALRKNIVPTFMFHTEKFKSDGSFDKDKCRMVLLSNLRDQNTIGESSSPTVNPISFFTQLNLAAVNPNILISAYDIKGAFLLTPMDGETRLFIKVPPDVVKYWIEYKPERRKWVEGDGCLYFELQRYIYGLHEASHAFQRMLYKDLYDAGFKPTRADPCLLVKTVKEGRIILSTHVDDLFLTSPNRKWQRWFEQLMEKKYELVKQYDEVSYLGMSVKRKKNGDITVDQIGYLKNLLLKYKCFDLARYPSTPATDSLTICSDKSPRTDSSEYLSLVMGLMYIARFTRPDILMSITFLSTRTQVATQEDMSKLLHILRYLSGTREFVMTYKRNIPFQPKISADASHHLHPSGHGQAGIIISNGSAPVAFRSTKIKMITRSSSESELVALEDASTYAVWYALLLNELGLDNVKPITIFQDNQSTIIIAIQGPSFKRTKHLLGRESFVKERILDGDIILKYLPTGIMTADLLTKPVKRSILVRLMSLLHINSSN